MGKTKIASSAMTELNKWVMQNLIDYSKLEDILDTLCPKESCCITYSPKENEFNFDSIKFTLGWGCIQNNAFITFYFSDNFKVIYEASDSSPRKLEFSDVFIDSYHYYIDNGEVWKIGIIENQSEVESLNLRTNAYYNNSLGISYYPYSGMLKYTISFDIDASNHQEEQRIIQKVKSLYQEKCSRIRLLQQKAIEFSLPI
ncbi:MAG: hypothetical protein IKG14_01125 [Clostridia bacterium]|nr:hypothetical protein [Clostridia bacterium]